MQCRAMQYTEELNNLVQACIARLLLATVTRKIMSVMVRGDGDSWVRFLWAFLGF